MVLWLVNGKQYSVLQRFNWTTEALQCWSREITGNSNSRNVVQTLHLWGWFIGRHARRKRGNAASNHVTGRQVHTDVDLVRRTNQVRETLRKISLHPDRDTPTSHQELRPINIYRNCTSYIIDGHYVSQTVWSWLTCACTKLFCSTK